MLGRFYRLGSEPVHQVGVDFARLQDAGAICGDPNQIGRAPFVDRQERVEHRRHQNGAARMRFEQGAVFVRGRHMRLPESVFHHANGIAQGGTKPEPPAELAGKLPKQVFA